MTNSLPYFHVDLNSITSRNRVVLATPMTESEQRSQGVDLQEGLEVFIWDEDTDDDGHDIALVFRGTVHFDSNTSAWVVEIDWNSRRNETDVRRLWNLGGIRK